MSGVDVSVVIPCFRAGNTIPRALASIAGQSSLPREIIVVDDASGDGTVAKIRSFNGLPPTVELRILELSRNAGAGSARNAGWDAARSALIAFLDADDSWHPRKLEVQAAFMSTHTEFALTGHAHRQVRDGDLAHDAPAHGFSEVLVSGLIWSNRFTTSSVMVRKEVTHRFAPGQRHMEDHRLWLDMAFSGSRIARLNAVLSYRYSAPFGENGLSGQMIRMESSELNNYRLLYGQGQIGPAKLVLLFVWSSLKFLRRLGLVAFRYVIQANCRRRSSL